MKKTLVSLFVLVLFSSCRADVERTVVDNTKEWNVSQSQVVLWESPFAWIKDVYFQNESFLQCSRESVDQCILSSISSETVLSLDTCDDLLLDSNKDSCKQNIITSQARESWDISLCNNLTKADSCKYEILVSRGITDKTIDVCNEVSEGLKAQCNNTIVQSLSYETLDVSWCDKYVSEFEWDDLALRKENCIRDIAVSQDIEAEISAQQVQDEKTIAQELIERERWETEENIQTKEELSPDQQNLIAPSTLIQNPVTE